LFIRRYLKLNIYASICFSVDSVGAPLSLSHTLSLQGTVACALWLLALPSPPDQANTHPPSTQLLYLNCQPTDICTTDRKTPQVGQIVLVSGMRIESIDGVMDVPIPAPIKHCVATPRQVVVASIVRAEGYESATKDHGGIINISAIAGLATSPGLFKPLPCFHDLSSLLLVQDKSVNCLVILLCTIAFSKRIERAHIPCEGNQLFFLICLYFFSCLCCLYFRQQINEHYRRRNEKTTHLKYCKQMQWQLFFALA
jgi:hypothetical protein